MVQRREKTAIENSIIWKGSRKKMQERGREKEREKEIERENRERERKQRERERVIDIKGGENT